MIQPQRLQKSKLSVVQTSGDELELRRLQFPSTMHGGEWVIRRLRASAVLQEQHHPPVYRKFHDSRRRSVSSYGPIALYLS